MALELVFRIVGGLLGGLGGWQLALALGDETLLPWGMVGVLLGAAIGLLGGPYVTIRPLRYGVRWALDIPAATLWAGVAGLIGGLVVAALLSIPFTRLSGQLGIWIPLGITVVVGILGIVLSVSRLGVLFQFIPDYSPGSKAALNRDSQIILDTSAIIDGRIADMSQTGFITGTFMIPHFVLDELRHIADSSDSLRRNRGRRGLEMLNKIRKEAHIPIKVVEADIRGGDGVDGKLVKLASALKAPILTTDYNLNRVAEIQGVKVLNINELANALKPVVLPGEEMALKIVQEGKESGQGIGFLEDGTMVVVENGRRYLNSEMDVTVTRVLQTAAGRIIFAQPKAA